MHVLRNEGQVGGRVIRDGRPSAEVFLWAFRGNTPLQPDPGQTNTYAYGLLCLPPAEPACFPFPSAPDVIYWTSLTGQYPKQQAFRLVTPPIPVWSPQKVDSVLTALQNFHFLRNLNFVGLWRWGHFFFFTSSKCQNDPGSGRKLALSNPSIPIALKPGLSRRPWSCQAGGGRRVWAGHPR